MSNIPDLFGKTFDQQVQKINRDINNADIRPNRLFAAEIVFEPVHNGIRVTARDSEHHTLWGFIASKEMLEQHPCQIAIYETLKSLIVEELSNQGVETVKQTDSVQTALNELKSLDEILEGIKESIEVIKVTSATKKRAMDIIRVVRDFKKMIKDEVIL
ncbi:MAG: hypothetical protein ABIH86_07100 [Planctomycetota bacterium]